MLGAIFIPTSFFHFVLSLLGMVKKHKKILVFAYILSSIFVILNLTNLFVKGVLPRLGFEFWPIPGPTYLPFLAMFISYVGYAHYLMFIKYKDLSGIERNQIKYVFFGTMIGFAGGATNYFLWYNIPIPPYGNILVSVYVAAVAYAIVKYRLMNIELAYRGGLIFTSYLLIILLFYIPLGLVLGKTIIGLIIFIVFVAGFSPFAYKYISKATRKAVDKGIFRGRFDYFETLLNDIENAKPLYKLNEVAGRIVGKIAKDMKVENCCLLVHDGWHDEFTIRSEKMGKVLSEEEKRMPRKLSMNDPLIKYFEQEKKTLMKEEIMHMPNKDNTSLTDSMSRIHAEIAMPIHADQKVIGILGIGKKKTGDIFDDADLKILDEFLKDNEKDIVHTYFMEERHVFSAKVSHDLRGPMGWTRSGLEELKLELLGPLNKAQKECVASVIDSTEISMRNLQQFFELNVIAQKVMKGEYVLIPVNIVETAENSEEKFKPEAKRKGIDITVEVSGETKSIMVMGNKEDLGRVFENLIANAIKHTKKGSITIGIDIGVGGITCKVQDTGAGIPEHCIPHVFKPFFHLHTLGEEKQQGTGLGLVIVKEIIEAHKGRVWVESTPADLQTQIYTQGQAEGPRSFDETKLSTRTSGTTFYFTLSFAK